jgi:hypothetical protein
MQRNTKIMIAVGIVVAIAVAVILVIYNNKPTSVQNYASSGLSCPASTQVSITKLGLTLILNVSQGSLLLRQIEGSDASQYFTDPNWVFSSQKPTSGEILTFVTIVDPGVLGFQDNNGNSFILYSNDTIRFQQSDLYKNCFIGSNMGKFYLYPSN